jgi:hypothetical protein
MIAVSSLGDRGRSINGIMFSRLIKGSIGAIGILSLWVMAEFTAVVTSAILESEMGRVGGGIDGFRVLRFSLVGWILTGLVAIAPL